MKIKNLKFMLLGLLAMGSMNVSAQGYKLSDGIRYVEDKQTGEDGTQAKPWSAKVYGATTAATTLSIPATFNVSDGNGATAYYKVSGFESGWATDNDVTTAGKQRKKISGTLASLTIDGTNMGDLTNAFTGLAKLTTVKVASKNETWTNEGYVTGQLGAAALNGQIESLDLSGMEKVIVTTGTLKGADWPKLTTVVLPSKLETLGANFFEGSKITTIELPTTIKVIDDHAFDASALTALNLNACVNLETIGSWAFLNCENLGKLQMSGIAKAKLTTIGGAAFYGTAITAANIPATVTTVGANAFGKCKELTQVSAMAGLTAIPDNMFNGCEKLTKVTISKNVATIGASAFEGCKALATVTFAERAAADPALTSIGSKAFKDCEALTSIDLSSKKFTFNQIQPWFDGCKALSEIKLSENITGIWGSAFKDAVFEDLDLSNTKLLQLDFIFGTGRTAATAYSSLKSIKLPETCSKFAAKANDGVFAYCTSLEEITIPNAFVTASAVPAYAFYYCTSLKKVTYSPIIEATAQVFATDAFLGCTPFVLIATNTYYTSYYANRTAPKNATYGTAADDVVKTVKDNGTSGKYFGKLCPLNDVTIDINDAKVYSIYIDGGTAYFQSLLQRGGKYIVKKNEHVIVKTDEAKEVKLTPYTGGQYSVTVDEMFSLKEDVPTSEIQGGTVAPAKVIASAAYVYACGKGQYIYRLTNNASTGGFGFTFFGGATMKEGQFFIISDKKPAGAAPLNIVWLDENGFVEEDGATAIQKVEAAEAENGAIYNLQGVRVKAAKKGLYIQNGKKYIMK